MDENWDQTKLEAGNLAQAVVKLHLVAYRNEENKGDKKGGLSPTNHWCLFLETAGHESVRIDMTPGNGSDGVWAHPTWQRRAGQGGPVVLLGIPRGQGIPSAAARKLPRIGSFSAVSLREKYGTHCI